MIELYTDASLPLPAHRASWAAALIRDGALVGQASGVFKAAPSSSTDAEAQALGNAIHWLKGSGLVEPGEKVCVRIDCLNVINAMTTRKDKPVTGKNKAALGSTYSTVRYIAGISGFDLSYLWVRGHQIVGESVDGDWNRLVDIQARTLSGQRKAKNQSRKRARINKRARARRESDAVLSTPG